MLSGVSITCFAASYAVALVLEITRLFFRSGLRGAIMLGFAAAGLLAHTIFLAYRAAGATDSPLSSKQDWYLIAAWVLVVVYLYLTAYDRKTAFGVFLLPLALGLIGIGALLADAEPFAREPASRVWGAIHGTAVLLATVAVLVGFVAGLMYLSQAYRLKHKLSPQRGLRLPSLEWLQRANSRAIVISMIMLGIGILSGVILNLINARSHAHQVPWNDPFVVSTLAMFGWLVLSSAIGLFYRPAREGRKVACLTVISFLFLVIALGMGLFVRTQHGGEMETRRPLGARRSESLQGHEAAVWGLTRQALGWGKDMEEVTCERCVLRMTNGARLLDSWDVGLRLPTELSDAACSSLLAPLPSSLLPRRSSA